MRVAAVEALQVAQDPRAVELLISALAVRRDWRVREAATKVLGELNHSHTFDLLTAALNGSPNLSVRLGAAEALGKRPDGTADGRCCLGPWSSHFLAG
ncbi:MAG: HEAT repeat domain-containing protein [Verrucomicrobia bacterium]|nr:HEAT repeat domain-containing protein [Verrucomicrobiota bacterium]